MQKENVETGNQLTLAHLTINFRTDQEKPVGKLLLSGNMLEFEGNVDESVPFFLESCGIITEKSMSDETQFVQFRNGDGNLLGNFVVIDGVMSFEGEVGDSAVDFVAKVIETFNESTDSVK